KTSSSAIALLAGRRARPRELGQFARLALQARELRCDDRDPQQHDDEEDPVRRGHVLLAGAHDASTSRRSRRFASVRFPASSVRYMTYAMSVIAAQERQNAANISPVICGPSRVNTVGWMKSFASRIAKKLTGIRATPKRAYTAEMRSRAGPGSLR